MKFDRQQFIEFARDVARMKVPFRHQGSSLETGMDCINLPRAGVEAQGLSLPGELNKEFEHYHEQPDGVRLLRIMRQWFVEVDEAEPGDLLILYARKNPQHLAILIEKDPPVVVEAYRSDDRKIGQILEQPLDPRRRIAAVFRIPDFAN